MYAEQALTLTRERGERGSEDYGLRLLGEIHSPTPRRTLTGPKLLSPSHGVGGGQRPGPVSRVTPSASSEVIASCVNPSAPRSARVSEPKSGVGGAG